MLRSKILDRAKDLITGDRARDYGDARENFERIARGWEVILGVRKITLVQVALCMAWVKIARLIHGEKFDSFVDLSAYGALAGEFAGADEELAVLIQKKATAVEREAEEDEQQ